MAATIKVGASAWTEKTLIEAGWYPPGMNDAESRLRYYASQFPITEVDAPYYALPTRHQGEVWAERTPPGFTMNVKAYALLTEHYTDPRRLPRDLLGELPAALRGKRRLYPRDVDDAFLDEVATRFRDAIEPLRAAGKLGVVLFQYPVWFPCARAARERLLVARMLVPGCRVAVEFRNATWMTPRNRTQTLRFLREHRLVYTAVDEPQGFPSSVPPVVAVTDPGLALVRFHGRAAETWEARAATAAERLSSRYSERELREWLPRLARLADEAAEVHVLMNNCHRDFGVRNAAELTEVLVAENVGHVVLPSAPPEPQPTAP